MKKKRPPALENPDIDFTANVRACELRFEEVPDTAEVSFRTHPERESFSGTERENLPEEVERGVTYRNISVKFRAASELKDSEPDLWEGRKEGQQ